jgi:hypothetical protein
MVRLASLTMILKPSHIRFEVQSAFEFSNQFVTEVATTVSIYFPALVVGFML